MEAKLLDIQPLKNGGWLLTAAISRFVWRKFRFVTTEEQFFTNHKELDYGAGWYYADTAIRVTDLDRELCRITYEHAQDEERKQRLFSLDTQVISNGDKRTPIK